MFTPYIILAISSVGGLLATFIGMIYATLKSEHKALKVKQEFDFVALKNKLEENDKTQVQLKLRLQKIEDIQGIAISHLTEKVEHIESKVDKMQISIEDLKHNIHKQANAGNGLTTAIQLLISKLDRDANQN